MTLERAFPVSSILLAGVGFLGLVLTGEIPGGLVLLGLASLVASATQAMALAGERLARQLASLSSATWNVFLLAVFVFFGADLLLISQDILPAAVHFLILLMGIKLFHLRQRKDFLQLYAISFLELLAAAALTVDLWYAGVFIAYVFVAIWTLILYHLRNEAEEARAAVQAGKELHDPSPIARTVTAQFFWTTNGIAVGSFCLTMAIFFLIPRIGAGFFQRDRVDLIRTSGFSEKVDLGVIGAVKLDPTVVMRVELPDQKAPNPEGLYFRGAAYDTYDGRSWANRLATRRLLGRTPDGASRSNAGSPRVGLGASGDPHRGARHDRPVRGVVCGVAQRQFRSRAEGRDVGALPAVSTLRALPVQRALDSRSHAGGRSRRAVLHLPCFHPGALLPVA